MIQTILLIFKPLARLVVLDPKLDGRYLPALSPPAQPGILKPPSLAVDRLLFCYSPSDTASMYHDAWGSHCSPHRQS